MNLMEAISRAGASGAAMVIWGLATVCVLGAVNEARLLTTSRESLVLARASNPPTIDVQEVSLSKDEYEKIVIETKNRHPNLLINSEASSGGSAITSATNDIAAYYDWLISIYNIMATQPDARWSTIAMCVGDGCIRNKYSITMTASKRVPVVKNADPVQ